VGVDHAQLVGELRAAIAALALLARAGYARAWRRGTECMEYDDALISMEKWLDKRLDE
jgi:hypothetical protein